MKHSSNGVKAQIIIVNIARVIIGLLLIFSGLVKGIDPIGGAIKMDEYFTAFQWDMPSIVPLLSAIILNSFEFILGAFLLLGLFKRWTSHLTALFMLFMTGLTLYLAIKNPISDCGCFGDAIKLTNWQTFIKNLFLLPMALLLSSRWQDIQAFLSKRHQRVIVTMLIVIGWGYFIYSNIYHLPIKDFRPFKVGTNINQLVSTTPDMLPEYEFVFYYEKDGVKEAFRLDSLPDKSWNYVERKEVIVKEGKKPPYEDFIIYLKRIDVTDAILQNTHKSVWLINHNWNGFNNEKKEQLDQLIKWTTKEHIPFYLISSTTEKENKQWYESYNSSTDIYFGDKVLLKTIARSNPTVVYIQDQRIINKLSLTDLPNEPEQLMHKGFRLKHYSLIQIILLILWAIYAIGCMINRKRNKY